MYVLMYVDWCSIKKLVYLIDFSFISVFMSLVLVFVQYVTFSGLITLSYLSILILIVFSSFQFLYIACFNDFI